MINKIFGTVILLGILTLTILKLPRVISRGLMWIPGWLQSLVIHFGYGGWIGGVTGHILGGMLSIPWFIISEMFLRPKILNRPRPSLKLLFGERKAS